MNSPQPTLFVPHGAPTFALRPGAAGAAVEQIAKMLPYPRGVVVISPHWDTPQPIVGTGNQHETIHDFWGFSEELYDIHYPAIGYPEGAEEIAKAIETAGFSVIRDNQRGLDHGAWVPLRFMYPKGDVPIIPLSLQSHTGPDGAYQLGQALAPVTERGFMIVATGSITHNLRDYQYAWQTDGRTPAYVKPFADWIAQRVAENDIPALLDYLHQAPSANQAHPTEEHLLPLFVALGAAGPKRRGKRVYAGIDDFVIAMDAYIFQPVD